ncbi:hypothetical protein BCR34DRAFT_623516 [Clohesyomyces aquaticus]|uniref:5-hydroxyisourate hydrolase n=1 Tax=Clohesyomyces aquaticus TaxID=1231657 RepID=A0A1Y1ZUT2_9PLEO|nr:hypothetical protein BCR34DRAFT_623516 [Clohesyomyces aquaticus]
MPPTDGATPDTPQPSKPPITCHVLDTTLGRPAPSIPVTLTLSPSSSPHHTTTSSSTPLKFSSTTNADGRVISWTPASPFSVDALETVFQRAGDQHWSLRFETEGYWKERGIEAFFGEVEVRFRVRAEGKGEHYHVPVLLGPFGYTTYRGS